ncbi:hypothetical protein GW17_00058798, partial [Ensete ventricosum]
HDPFAMCLVHVRGGEHKHVVRSIGTCLPSLSLDIVTRVDAKALQALEAMKSFHDLDSVVTLKPLALIWKRYNIPDEYVLHTLGPEQCPYHPCPRGFSISIDAFEAGLRFPLHPVIGECLG